jgi:hypothetical protein
MVNWLLTPGRLSTRPPIPEKEKRKEFGLSRTVDEDHRKWTQAQTFCLVSREDI